MTLYVYGQGAEPIYEEVYNIDPVTSVIAAQPRSKTTYFSLGTKRLARSENGVISYYYTDHLGSTRITKDAQNNFKTIDYEPFGAELSSTYGEKYTFSGKEDDGVTGLSYMNGRYYNAQIGRFINEDPAKDGANWYVYCYNNPLRYKDPSGKIPVDTIIDLISVAVDIGRLMAGDKRAVGDLLIDGVVCFYRIFLGCS